MKYLSLFSGIGGFELGIQRADRDGIMECVGFSEIDRYAIQVYNKNFNHKNYGDITRIKPENLSDFEMVVGGFPCQAFSIAGKRGGFNDTRGTLFFEIARIIKQKQPRILLLENVKGLLSHDKGSTFTTIISTLDELGYDCQWQVLNSKNFGVPQNRERVFIIGYLRGTSRPKVFPITRDTGKTLKQVVGGSQGMRVYEPEGISCTIASQAGGLGAKTGLYAIPQTKDGNAYCIDANYHKGQNNPKKCTRTAIAVITPDRVNKRQNGRRFKENGEPSFTLTAQDKHGIYDGVRIRRLTPKECERLQGFPDDWTKYGNENKTMSDTQRYKMCGNAVTVNVIEEIMKRILK